MLRYVITDGDRFIYRTHNGKYVPTNSESMADMYSKKQAESIFQNALPRALKGVFYVKQYDEPPEQVKQVTREDLKKNTEKVSEADNIQRWIKKAASLNGMVKEAADRKEELNKELSTLDKEISDILHYCEFAMFNASQGYKISKILKERRVKRRSVKNELEVIEVILGQRVNNVVAETLQNTLQTLDSRTYKPRELDWLFNL